MSSSSTPARTHEPAPNPDDGGHHRRSIQCGVAAGDRLPATPDGDLWFDVVGADPERALVLRSSIDLMKRRNFDPHGPAPRRFSDGTWAFVLDLKRRAERAPAP